jgi:hypothetical protein
MCESAVRGPEVSQDPRHLTTRLIARVEYIDQVGEGPGNRRRAFAKQAEQEPLADVLPAIRYFRSIARPGGVPAGMMQRPWPRKGSGQMLIKSG